MYRNILTGGIGCGKSLVADMLIQEGYEVIFADKISAQILQDSADIIAHTFGEDIIIDGIVSKEKLGSIIFSDPNKRQILESILHPKIRQRILDLSQDLESKRKDYFIELPLYFESKYTYECKRVICVYANRDLQIKRVMARNNLSKDEAIKRVDSQIDIEIKRQKSDFVIDNTKDKAWLQIEFKRFLSWLNS